MSRLHYKFTIISDGSTSLCQKTFGRLTFGQHYFWLTGQWFFLLNYFWLSQLWHCHIVLTLSHDQQIFGWCNFRSSQLWLCHIVNKYLVKTILVDGVVNLSLGRQIFNWHNFWSTQPLLCHLVDRYLVNTIFGQHGCDSVTWWTNICHHNFLVVTVMTLSLGRLIFGRNIFCDTAMTLPQGQQ